jgi:hypothetical protein
MLLLFSSKVYKSIISLNFMSLEEFVLLTKDKSPEARGEVSDFVDESNIYELEEPSESETLGFTLNEESCLVISFIQYTTLCVKGVS